MGPKTATLLGSPAERPATGLPVRVGRLLRLLACLILFAGCGACSETAEPTFLETTEVVPLPPGLASFKAANQIGSDLHHALLTLMESDPQRFNPRQVGYQVNWGKMEDMASGESVFFIRLIGKSVKPIAEEPAAQELMHHGIQTLYQLIETTESYVST